MNSWEAEQFASRKVEPGDELILEDREQRDLEGVPSFLALRDERKETGTPYRLDVEARKLTILR